MCIRSDRQESRRQDRERTSADPPDYRRERRKDQERTGRDRDQEDHRRLLFRYDCVRPCEVGGGRLLPAVLGACLGCRAVIHHYFSLIRRSRGPLKK